MTDPQVGDIVDITIKAARVKRAGGPGFTIFDIDGHGNNLTLMTALTAVTVTVVEPATPAEWPPRLGDLWRDRDRHLWFGIDVTGSDDPIGPVVELVGPWGEHHHPADIHRRHGPLQLVRREQAEQPDGSWPPRAGDVWRDRDGDDWTAIDMADGKVMRVYPGGGVHYADYVQDNYGPLVFVSHEPPKHDEAQAHGGTR